MGKSKKNLLNSKKPIHPYSRKAKQLKRELLKPEKKTALNPLKELLLKKTRLFKEYLETSTLEFLQETEILDLLDSYFSTFDNLTSNLKNDYKKSLIDSEKRNFENGSGIGNFSFLNF
jgi:hypothetical protein